MTKVNMFWNNNLKTSYSWPFVHTKPNFDRLKIKSNYKVRILHREEKHFNHDAWFEYWEKEKKKPKLTTSRNLGF
jgi:hypothetical protein